MIKLLERTRGFQALNALLSSLLRIWPEHEKFMERSFTGRDAALMKTSDRLSAMVINLEGDQISGLCEDYRWMCAQLLEAELEFRRTGAYQRRSFAEVARDVYGNPSFMRRYIRGLLLSQVM